MAVQQAPGWYNDPTGRFSNRYWDGNVWTEAVSSGGSNANDPIAPGETHGPPAPGTEARATPAPAAQVAPAVNISAAGGSSGASVIGPIIAVIAVLIAVILLVVVLTGGDDADDETPDDPATTEAPETTEAPPPDEGGDGDGG